MPGTSHALSSSRSRATALYGASALVLLPSQARSRVRVRVHASVLTCNVQGQPRPSQLFLLFLLTLQRRSIPTDVHRMAEEDLDYALALSLQEEFNRGSIQLSPKRSKVPPPVHSVTKEYDPRSIVDNSWELTDPNPNIHDLFVRFDQMFFEGTLVSRGVAVSWSNKMTLLVNKYVSCPRLARHIVQGVFIML